MKRTFYTVLLFAIVFPVCAYFGNTHTIFPAYIPADPTPTERFVALRGTGIKMRVNSPSSVVSNNDDTVVSNNDDTLKNSRILVYTKNGKGYVHDNIASAVAALKVLAAENSFTIDISDDPGGFNESNLKKYALLVFTSTNNDVFDTDEQRVAFRRYMEAGGGFVGVHSVTGTERNWKWFKQMIGETFSWHAKFQKFSVKKIDASHPSMEGVPAVWEREDECYFGKELYPGIKVLMAHDVHTLNTKEKSQDSLLQKNLGSFTDYYPAVWYQHFEGGNVWITTLGHSKESYQDPVYVNHLLQGLKFIANQYKGLNYANAHAVAKDDGLKN